MNKKAKKPSRRCYVTGVDGVRRNFKFPDVTRKDTLEKYKAKLKSLVLAKRLGDIPTKDMTWITEQDDAMKRRLARLGVIDNGDIMPNKAKPLPTIADWSEEVIKLKTGTKSKGNIANVRNKLVAYFGKEKRIDEVTKADAKRYWAYVIDKENGYGLAQHSTARRHMGYCREIWDFAIDDEKLKVNPFKQKKLPTCVKTNPDRHHFITNDVAQRMYDVINNDEYRLRFVLMRYAGLRAPSELNALKWTDVDFDKGNLTIHSPKTAHHDDRGIRRLPIFAEVLVELNKAWDKLEFGSKEEYVLPRISNNTLRKHVLRWIGTIGEDVWRQLLTNFRRSAKTDKAYDRYPSHVLNAWFGHSESVSEVYEMDTEDARNKAGDGFTTAQSRRHSRK